MLFVSTLRAHFYSFKTTKLKYLAFETHNTMEEHKIKMDMFPLNSSDHFAPQITDGDQAGELLPLYTVYTDICLFFCTLSNFIHTAAPKIFSKNLIKFSINLQTKQIHDAEIKLHL